MEKLITKNFIIKDNENNRTIVRETVNKVMQKSNVVSLELTDNTAVKGYYTAGETLSGGSVVYLHTNGKVYKASSNIQSQANKIVGISQTAVSMNGTATIVKSGEVTGMVNLVIGTAYYLGLNGALTATKPTSGFSLTIGIAKTATIFNIEIKESYILS